MSDQLLRTAYDNTRAALVELSSYTLTRKDVTKTRDYLRAALAAIESLESAMRTGQEPKEGE